MIWVGLDVQTIHFMFPSYCSYHFLSPIAVKFHLSRSNNLVGSNSATPPFPSSGHKPPNPSTPPRYPHSTCSAPNPIPTPASQIIQPQRTNTPLYTGGGTNPSPCAKNRTSTSTSPNTPTAAYRSASPLNPATPSSCSASRSSSTSQLPVTAPLRVR